MKYRFYTTSQKAWDGMFKAIAAAQKTIYMEMYIFLDNTQSTHNFLGLLKEKARAGLEVVIIADSVGSFMLSGNAVSELRKAGIEFIYFSHWLQRTHRKILIIDNKLAFIGGVNIEEKLRHWRDLQVRIDGKVVIPLLKSFAYVYQDVGGKKESILKYSRMPLVKKIKSWITDTIVGENKPYNLSVYFRDKINDAKISVKILTPYFLPPRRLIAYLEAAALRGVNVEILIPNDTDWKILNKFNYLNACRLAVSGVKFYLMPMMNHAKIMIIDDEEGLIGSQNIDVLSFNMNMEAGVFFKQKQAVKDLVKLFEHWRQESIYFNGTHKKIPWYDKILIDILKIFYPIL